LVDSKILEQTMRSFMYRHPVGGRHMRHAITIIVIVAAVIAVPFSALLVPAHHAGAALGPKIVDGYIRDTGGSPVSGANVTVKVFDGATLRATQYYVPLTGSDGFYTVTFRETQYDVGNTILVTATKGLQTGTNSAAIVDEEPQSIDVTLDVIIPEFSGYLPVVGGTLLVAALALGASRGRRSGQR